MLNHWLSPIELNDFPHFDSLSADSFGKKIALHAPSSLRKVGDLPDLSAIQIAILGIGAGADSVRRVLYGLSFPFGDLSVADLGNLRKEEISFIIPLLNELMQGGIVPIIIGHSEVFTLAQYQAFQYKKGSVNVVIADEKIRLSPDVPTQNFALQQILDDMQLFHCSLVGYQSHFVPPSVLAWLARKNFDTVRLGKLKSNMEDLEPVIRDADMMSLNLSILKQIEAPGQSEATPSGLFSEEVCQMARYAGMSDKMTSFSIIGFQPDLDKNDQTAHIVAQMIWYFIDGFFGRKQDFPIQKAFNQLTQYVVDIKSVDFQITFWKSNKSGRWWMEVPLKTRKKHERHRLVPCSYSDYLFACQEDDLPERLLTALARFK